MNQKGEETETDKEDMNSQRPVETEDTDLESVESLLDYAWRSYETQAERFQRLDSKASTLAGFTGVIITLALTRSDIFSLGDAPLTLAGMLCLAVSRFLCIVLVLSLGGSFTYALFCLSLRDVKGPPALEDVVNAYRRNQKEANIRRVLLKSITSALCSAESSLHEANNAKARSINASTTFLAIGLFSGLLAFVFQALSSLSI